MSGHIRLSAVLVVLLTLAGSANAHIIMNSPKPFGNPDNSPLSSSGENYPCKITGDPATFYSGTTATEMAAGTDQTLSFTGSAVHGGGSCQLAITSDMQPSASTTWQVIQSIEGGCPSKDGTSPSEYNFQIPEGTAAGDYVFAWTWISKLAGQPEYYMNCAPIRVTGNTSKRSSKGGQEMVTRNTLPDLFVANLANINSCKTTPGTDPQFPEPGDNVVRPNSAAEYSPVSGSNCFAAASPDSPGSGEENPDTGSGSPDVTATQATSSAPPATSSSGFVTSVTSDPASTTTTPGGVFVTMSSVSAPPSATGLPGENAGGLSGACTSEGTFNCVGGSQYQQCAAGSWTALQNTPPGTSCAEGESTTLWARQSQRGRLRLRRDHMIQINPAAM